MPLVEYAKKNKKEFKESLKHPLINFIYLFILLFFSYINFGLYSNRAGSLTNRARMLAQLVKKFKRVEPS
jgi:hypothetical protein